MKVRSKPLVAILCALTFVGLAFTIAAFVADESRMGHAGPLTDPTDFVAFYCGGEVLAMGRDPYRAEPLRGCEDAAFSESHIVMMQHLVVPAPLPPYALTAFAGFSFMSFRTACAVFYFASLAATIATVVLCCRLAPISRAFVTVTTLAALGIGSIYIGQIVPFIVCALAASAAALRSKKMGTAAAFASLAMVEPHVGIASILALYLLVPRTRPWLVINMCALAAVSILSGSALNAEYVTQVLPAHALSEVANFHAQYSLTAILYALGMGASAAVRAGEASYLVMLVCGLWLARRLRRMHADDAFVVLAPPACLLVGGVYLHDHQMAVALPFAFVLAGHVGRRAILFAAIALFAIPWQSIFEMFLVPLFPSHLPFDPGHALALVSSGSVLAETPWRVWIGLLGGRDGRTPFEMFLFKLPTWLALGTIAVVAVRSHAQAPLRPPLRSAIRR